MTSNLACNKLLTLFPSLMCVFVSQKKKKKKDNCPTLLKKVCCILYNLPHPFLKATMAFQ